LSVLFFIDSALEKECCNGAGVSAVTSMGISSFQDKKIKIINKVSHLYLSSTLLFTFLKKKGYKFNTARKAIIHLFRR